MQFYSPAGQDEQLLQLFFRGKRDGRFLVLGDDAAIHTKVFAEFMDWQGASKPEVQADAHGVIDLCVIGAKSYAANVLQTIDFDRAKIEVILLDAGRDADEAAKFLAAKGYDAVTQSGPSHIFKRKHVKRLATTSVICAVWHGDAKRHELLRAHAANLVAQTIPVEPIYVFDNGDPPPVWLEGRCFSAREKLSIYQAWNLGLSLVATPYMMNLNLDDRLAPDAVATLEAALRRENASVAGGDWKLCYSQEDTDKVESCYPSSRIPFLPARPPAPGSLTRLGSGNERATLGPAVMWRTDVHLAAPRYPWRFPDGTLIRTVADGAWWVVLQQHAQAKLARLPLIIGNYHSHPADQAEYRSAPYDERELLQKLGVSLI